MLIIIDIFCKIVLEYITHVYIDSYLLWENIKFIWMNFRKR